MDDTSVSHAEPAVPRADMRVDIVCTDFGPATAGFLTTLGRAVLNGIAAGMEKFFHLASNAGPWEAQRIVATGNAVRRNPLLIQRLADLFELPVDLPVHREEAAYGAALLAGSQTGFWPSLAEAGQRIRHERAAIPQGASR